jgi:cysteinyl-tRNA synthetase
VNAFVEITTVLNSKGMFDSIIMHTCDNALKSISFIAHNGAIALNRNLTVKKKKKKKKKNFVGAMNTTLERQQALANLMDMLHENAPDDADPDVDEAVHALVKALERNVADSNPVIAERTLLALDALVEQRGVALRTAMAELVPKVAERLGDRRDEVSDVCDTSVVWCLQLWNGGLLLDSSRCASGCLGYC